MAVAYTENFRAYFDKCEDRICKTISASIVDDVLNGLLAERSEDDEDIKENFLKYDKTLGSYQQTLMEKSFNVVISQIQNG